MGDLYLKKSDVMAKFYYSPVALADISTLPTHTFPDPSDAVDGDLISRKALLERLNMPFLKYMQTKANGRRLIYLDEVHEVITEMPLPPAPSVDDEKPANNKEIPNSSFKLESGKLYRTRDGRKAFVATVAVAGSATLIEGLDELKFTWPDGRFDKYSEHPYDLISLWDEPAPESDTSKLPEMIDDLERAYAANQPIRATLIAILREIARLLAERGDK